LAVHHYPDSSLAFSNLKVQVVALQWMEENLDEWNLVTVHYLNKSIITEIKNTFQMFGYYYHLILHHLSQVVLDFEVFFFLALPFLALCNRANLPVYHSIRIYVGDMYYLA
jgi:hypothetical protein